MIVAALGAISGIFCFFHGFSLLQQRWPSSVQRSLKASTSDVPTTPQKATAEAGKRDARAEIIQLTPQNSGELSAASMTQQGRIAAALQKAGVPSPATWSTDDDRMVGTKDPHTSQNQPASSEAEVSRVLQQGANASAFRIPALNPNTAHSSNRKATVLIWGGPALTLGCIYYLVAHLGWL